MPHHDSGSPAWMLTFFPVLFPAWWCFVIYLISRFGWAGLAEAYRAGEPPVGGITYRRRDGKVRWLTNYNGCLNVTLTGAGLYVETMWMFRPFHPSLLLPWRGVRSVVEKRPLFLPLTEVQFADDETRKMTLYLPAAALAEIATVSGRHDFSPLPSGRDQL